MIILSNRSRERLVVISEVVSVRSSDNETNNRYLRLGVYTESIGEYRVLE